MSAVDRLSRVAAMGVRQARLRACGFKTASTRAWSRPKDGPGQLAQGGRVGRSGLSPACQKAIGRRWVGLTPQGRPGRGRPDMGTGRGLPSPSERGPLQFTGAGLPVRRGPAWVCEARGEPNRGASKAPPCLRSVRLHGAAWSGEYLRARQHYVHRRRTRDKARISEAMDQGPGIGTVEARRNSSRFSAHGRSSRLTELFERVPKRSSQQPSARSPQYGPRGRRGLHQHPDANT